MKTNYCGRKMQEDMLKRGWSLHLTKNHETDDELFERLSKQYRKVKVYYVTTAIRGYYNYIAFTKDRIY